MLHQTESIIEALKATIIKTNASAQQGRKVSNLSFYYANTLIPRKNDKTKNCTDLEV